MAASGGREQRISRLRLAGQAIGESAILSDPRCADKTASACVSPSLLPTSRTSERVDAVEGTHVERKVAHGHHYEALVLLYVYPCT